MLRSISQKIAPLIACQVLRGTTINLFGAAVSAKGFHLIPSTTSSILMPLNPTTPQVATRNLLNPATLLITQVAGFKVKGQLHRRCKDCQFVIRQQRLYVICKTHPRHKQMAMKARDYKSWILTHATQSKIRPY